MDASFSLARLMQDFNAHLESSDFEGAEGVMTAALGMQPRLGAFFHFQLGLLYARWNKLSSAINHLNHALDGANPTQDETLYVQILEAIRSTQDTRARQRP